MSTYTRKGVEYSSSTQEVVDCLFCRITSKDPREPSVIVDENEKYVTFENKFPTTSSHLLISPKQHIRNIKSLAGPNGAVIIEEMVAAAKDALRKTKLSDAEIAGTRFCFHIPPYNSIDHLHLHAISRTHEMDYIGWLKYYPDSFYCKTADSIIRELKADNNRPPESRL
jgi:diadenosine tetraphosphate (Ap4A) HIT family hydrolase